MQIQNCLLSGDFQVKNFLFQQATEMKISVEFQIHFNWAARETRLPRLTNAKLERLIE